MGEIFLLFFIIVCATVVSNYLFNRIYSFFYRRHDERRSAFLAIKGAIQWTGENLKEVMDFCPIVEFNSWEVESYQVLLLPTIMGKIRVGKGDFIVVLEDGGYSVISEKFYKFLNKSNK